ncbi:hypothetical protein WICPIJ_005366 [Wickerhamomyces pijperi]|uniref:Uncharacterized protein n=1 Tax=Wickerhamomyces pijperi TaxID=599730 RepID=A0A9P8Q5Y5_WICPI|nr:hypothetical protein WICPIJ_005366 [Wickerhamomyces pijperi]
MAPKSYNLPLCSKLEEYREPKNQLCYTPEGELGHTQPASSLHTGRMFFVPSVSISKTTLSDVAQKKACAPLFVPLIGIYSTRFTMWFTYNLFKLQTSLNCCTYHHGTPNIQEKGIFPTSATIINIMREHIGNKGDGFVVASTSSEEIFLKRDAVLPNSFDVSYVRCNLDGTPETEEGQISMAIFPGEKDSQIGVSYLLRNPQSSPYDNKSRDLLVVMRIDTEAFNSFYDSMSLSKFYAKESADLFDLPSLLVHGMGAISVNFELGFEGNTKLSSKKDQTTETTESRSRCEVVFNKKMGTHFKFIRDYDQQNIYKW